MVAALLHPQTIFTVLADAARQRTRRGLIVRFVASVVSGTLLLIVAPQWWSVSALAGAVACYAVWGLTVAPIARAPSGRGMRAVSPAIATLGTALGAAGLVGLAAALFTGNGRSPYTPCGPGANSAYCRAERAPPPTTRVP